MAADNGVAADGGTRQHNVLVRAVWFLLVGWWASGIWLSVAWFLVVTVVGLPLGIAMINKVPFVVSLKRRRLEVVVEADERGRTVTRRGPEQHSLLVRAVWFLFVGWWLSGLWMAVAWAFSATVIGLPVAVWMYDRLPFVVSLYRLE